jgi:cytochrome c peroxidase
MTFLNASLKIIALGMLLGQLVSAQAFAADLDLSSYVKPGQIPTLAFNPLTPAKIQLGQKLFHDTRLSGRNTVSCASCHQPGYVWTDPNRFSVGEAGEPRPRRTPTLQDIAWNKLYARDGRVETLEGFILGPIAHPKEMNQSLVMLPKEIAESKAYDKLYPAAFGNASVTLDGLVQALASYVRTLRSRVSPFDRWVAGEMTALTSDMKEGFDLFNGKAACGQCHSGWRFSDQDFHDIGLKTKDIGRAKIDPQKSHLKYAFKTPSLRNVAKRSPYMHNGSLRNLDDVLKHYTEDFIERESTSPRLRRIKLTDQEKDKIILFLNSLPEFNKQVQLNMS